MYAFIHRHQRGQVAILFALGSAALVAFVGLVIMAGLLYWNQREIQADVDAAALSGAAQLPGGACSSSSLSDQNVIATAVDTLSTRVSPGSTPPSTSGWTCGIPLGPLSFGNNVKATFCYPWQSRPDEVGVILNQSNQPFFFSNFLGTPGSSNPGAQSCTSAPLQQASGTEPAVGGWAVAQRNFYAMPKSFGLVATQGLTCQGSGAKIDVEGSIYAGPSASPSTASLNHQGNCAIYAHKATDPSGNTDWGDILAYDQTPLGNCSSASNPCWLGSAGKCTAPAGTTPGYGVKASICADGFELQGYASPSCGFAYPPSLISPPASMYMTASELTGSPNNPNPCDGVPPLVPTYTTSQFITSEPNLDSSAIATLKNPSAPGAGCSPSQVLSQISFTYQTYTYTGFGTGPSSLTNLTGLTTPVDSNGYVHFSPGCYGFIDLNTLLTAGGRSAPTLAGAVFDPGFYYFNGNGYSGGGGLCMDGKTTQVLGQDVTLEFVNGSSFSTGNCNSSPSPACGNSASCNYGFCSPITSSYCSGTGTTDACTTGCPSGGYGYLTSPCTSTAYPGKCLISSSSWCPSNDSACMNVLIWSPASNTGSFYVKGPSQTSFLLGDVLWAGGPTGQTPQDGSAGCTWIANSGGELVGEFVCDTLFVQGGSAGGIASVGQQNAASLGTPPEAALVE